MEKKFAKGIFFERREQAPDFVIGKVSIKVAEFVPYLKETENGGGYVNIDIKKSKGGKYYCELNTWKKEEKPKPSEIDDVNPATMSF